MQLVVITTKLEVGGSKHPTLLKKVEPAVKHLKTTKGDYIAFLDAHSDYESGEIIYGQNSKGEDVSDELDTVCVPDRNLMLDLNSSLFITY